MTVFSDAAPEHAEPSAALLMETSPPVVLVAPSAQGCHKGPSPRAAKSANAALMSPANHHCSSTFMASPALQSSPLMPRSLLLWIYPVKSQG